MEIVIRGKTIIKFYIFIISLEQFIFNYSGSSSGSSSIPHSFSVDEIQKMRVKLKSSKSYPNDLLRQQLELEQQQKQQKETTQKQQNQQIQSKSLEKDKLSANQEEGDNSSSGVSSDQEVTVTHTTSITSTSISTSTITVTAADNHKNNNKDISLVNALKPSAKIIETKNKKSINLPPLSNVTKKISTAIISTTSDENKSINDNDMYNNDDVLDSPSPPSKGFQRHNSLTRKQAASIAINRSIHTRNAVSLVQLPPPLEGDSDTEQQQSHNQILPMPMLSHVNRTSIIASSARAMIQQHQQQQQQRVRSMASNVVVVVPPPMAYDKNPMDASPSQENIVLAPPPQFCDCTNASITKINNNNNAAGLIADNNGMINASATNSNNTNTARGVRIVGAVPKISRLHSH